MSEVANGADDEDVAAKEYTKKGSNLPPETKRAGSKRKRTAKHSVMHSESETSNEFYYYKDNDAFLGDDDEEDGPVGTAASVSSYAEPISSDAALARGHSQLFSSASQAAAATILNSTDTLAYSWDGLKLGSEVGIAALAADSSRVSHRLKDSANAASSIPPEPPEPLSTTQTLHMIRRLRPKTCLPPPGSGLFGVVRRTKFENERWYGGDHERFADEVDKRIMKKALSTYGKQSEAMASEHCCVEGGETVQEKGEKDVVETLNEAKESSTDKASCTREQQQHESAGETSIEKEKEGKALASKSCAPVVPFTALARVYETLCSQDADDGTAFRNGCNYLTSSAMVDQLRSVENELLSELEMRERDVMRGSSDLVDDTTKDVALLLGYRTLEDMAAVKKQD
mmetsp:Transcript_15489/g.34578  ORF Transcript_15489/g.34578 Transcript_15489/m.34578 type:complete len:400 (-) Transcript_15489:60-1259(-)